MALTLIDIYKNDDFCSSPCCEKYALAEIKTVDLYVYIEDADEDFCVYERRCQKCGFVDYSA